jgi:hypothetical protein
VARRAQIRLVHRRAGHEQPSRASFSTLDGYAIPDAQLSRLRGGCVEVGDACQAGFYGAARLDGLCRIGTCGWPGAVHDRPDHRIKSLTIHRPGIEARPRRLLRRQHQDEWGRWPPAFGIVPRGAAPLLFAGRVLMDRRGGELSIPKPPLHHVRGDIPGHGLHPEAVPQALRAPSERLRAAGTREVPRQPFASRTLAESLSRHLRCVPAVPGGRRRGGVLPPQVSAAIIAVCRRNAIRWPPVTAVTQFRRSDITAQPHRAMMPWPARHRQASQPTPETDNDNLHWH